MKKSVLLTFFFLLLFSKIYGQDYKPWNVSLTLSPFYRSIILAPATSRSFGERLELGFMPIIHYYQRKHNEVYNFKETSFGLNVTGRYFIARGQIMEPYVSSVIGFGTNWSESSFNLSNGTRDEYSYQNNFVNVTILLGNEIKLGTKGWVFDFNVGLLGIYTFDSYNDFTLTPMYSFGIKKKFGIK